MRSDAVDSLVGPKRGSANGSAAARPNAGLSLRAINGMRGPGALAIAFAHFAVVTDYFTYGKLEPIALVVDLFFVFSGVVIAQTYGAKLNNPSAIPEYIVRRFGRIWPLQAATLGILVVYELVKLVLVTYFEKQSTSPPFALDGSNPLWAVPTNLLLVQALGVHDRETWNFPSWSLSVEFFTYIAFAAFCLLRPLQRYLLSSATIFLSIAVLIFVAPFHMRSTFDFGIFRCLAGFFAGTLCYEAMARWSLPRWPFPTLVEIASLVLVGAWLSIATGGSAAFAAPFVFCLLVAVLMAERGAISRLLAAKSLQFLAELSFAIYMIHAIVLLFFLAGLHMLARAGFTSSFISVPNPLAGSTGARAIVELFHIDNPVVFLAMAIAYGAIVIGLAFLAYRYVEVPSRAFFARLAKTTKHPAEPKVSPGLSASEIGRSVAARRSTG